MDTNFIEVTGHNTFSTNQYYEVISPVGNLKSGLVSIRRFREYESGYVDLVLTHTSQNFSSSIVSASCLEKLVEDLKIRKVSIH